MKPERRVPIVYRGLNASLRNQEKSPAPCGAGLPGGDPIGSEGHADGPRIITRVLGFERDGTRRVERTQMPAGASTSAAVPGICVPGVIQPRRRIVCSRTVRLAYTGKRRRSPIVGLAIFVAAVVGLVIASPAVLALAQVSISWKAERDGRLAATDKFVACVDALGDAMTLVHDANDIANECVGELAVVSVRDAACACWTPEQ